MEICDIEMRLSVFCNSPGGVSCEGSGPPLTPGDPGGFLRTLLLSGLAALFSGMEADSAGSDTFRAGAAGAGAGRGAGLGAFGSCIKTRGPVAPMSCLEGSVGLFLVFSSCPILDNS